jgi:hypothetical protein
MKRKLFPLAFVVVFALSGCNMKPKPAKVPGPSHQSGAPKTREELESGGARCAGRTCTMPNGDIYDCTVASACTKVGGDDRR